VALSDTRLSSQRATAMPARKNDLRPDAKGRYRPYLGWKDGDDGVRRQHRFNLGTDRKVAESRMSRLRELWHEVEKAAEEAPPIWTSFTLYAANLIAEGTYKIPYPFDMSVIGQLQDPVAEYAQLLHVLRESFPSLDLIPAEPDLYAEGLRRNEAIKHRGLRDLESEMKDLGVITSQSPLPERLISGTLHEALNAYAEHDVKKHNLRPGTDRLTLYGNLRLERTERFKQHHADIPLSSLNYDACEDMIRHWRQRPPHKKTGKITGKDNARHHISELDRFFGWLDQADRFAWTKPRGIEKIDRALRETDEEKARKLSAIQKDMYSVEELAILNRHATPIERLVLYVGVNFAMGAAELGRLRVNNFLLLHKHEHAGRLNFISTETDSFVRTLRPKTTVFGEWLLWPETVQMVQWGIARRKTVTGFGPDALIFVSESGGSWYSEGSKNPQVRFTKVWNDLIKRVRKEKEHEEFRRLPLGTLRDTLPDIIRHRYGDDLASLCVAHGNAFAGDSLLDCYTNRPFGRLHTAIRELHQHLAPVFAAAPDDPVAKPRKRYTSLGTQERILSLLGQNAPVAKTAAECGVDRQTIYRIRDLEKPQ
jgi:hypothetical protein